MQNTFTIPLANRIASLGCIGSDPSRLMTVREWWHEMDEPVEMLADPQATFAEDTREMIRLSVAHGITYQPCNGPQQAAFPVWLLGVFYPANP